VILGRLRYKVRRSNAVPNASASALVRRDTRHDGQVALATYIGGCHAAGGDPASASCKRTSHAVLMLRIGGTGRPVGRRPRSREEPAVDQEYPPPGPPLPEALLQVEGQQPVTLAHLERVNPALSPEDRAAIRALRVGRSLTLSYEGSTVRVRRTR
jgi:hypothetical protein